MSKEATETKEIALPVSDFTMKDLELVQKFKDEGMVGLAKVTDVDIERCMALYMDGKTYRQIASVLKIKKDTILFLAHKFKWYELKTQYLEELSVTMPQKVMDSKLQSQEFFLHLQLAYQRKISRSVDKYLKTDDSQWTDSIDVKDVNTLIKITELIHKLGNESFGNPNDKSMVSLNGLTDNGMTITKTGANSIEITPKSPFSSKLKAFADMKREQEKAQQAPAKTHDIIDVEAQNKESEK